MDQVNKRFQELLVQKQFLLQKTERPDGCIYKGRLNITTDHLVNFAVWIEKNDSGEATAQIIFNNIAQMEDETQRPLWLDKINEINRTQGLYYYLVLDKDNRIFARYVTQVSEDNVVNLYRILKKGGTIVRNAIHELEELL